MKKQKNTFDVEFFINPNYDYKNHKLNVLKECLRAWLDPINEKFIPNEDDFIFFATEHMETLNSQIYLIECHASWDWVSRHNLFAEIQGLISFYE